MQYSDNNCLTNTVFAGLKLLRVCVSLASSREAFHVHYAR